MFSDKQFEEYVKVYKDTIFRVAFNYLKSRSDADDITQNVLIKLYRTDKSFESEAHIKYWLIRVTINECKRTLISPWRRVEQIDDYAGTLSFKTPEQTDLFTMVMELPSKYRVVIYLYYFENYSTEEIALMTGVSKSTVGTHLNRAREKLKKNLTEGKNNA